MGYVLGLLGHSDDPGDVMYSLMNEAQDGLSDRDRTTLRVLYSCPRFAVWLGPRPREEFSGRYPKLRMGFDRYRLENPHKAFALLLDTRRQRSTYGWASEEPSVEAAIEKALERCEETRGELRGACRVFAVGNELKGCEPEEVSAP